MQSKTGYSSSHQFKSYTLPLSSALSCQQMLAFLSVMAEYSIIIFLEVIHTRLN